LKGFVKDQLIGLLIACFVFTPTAWAIDVAECSLVMTKADLLEDAKSKILKVSEEIKSEDDLDNLEKISDIKSETALALANLNADKIIDKYIEEMEILDDNLEALKACGKIGQCILMQAKKLKLRANALRQVIFSSMKAEREAKVSLKADVEKISDQMADYLIYASLNNPGRAYPSPYNSSSPDDLRQEYARRIYRAIDSKFENSPSFVREMGLVYINTFRSGRLRELFTIKEVKADYLKNLGTTLFLQFLARTIFSKIPVIGNSKPIKNDLWVAPNTGAMMALQAGAGGETTPIIDRPFSTFEGALRTIPAVLHGRDGFSTDFKKKFLKFYSVIGLELPISILLRMANNAIFHLQNPSVLATAGGLGLFYAYYATKWAAVDNKTNLNFTPNLHKGTETEFNALLFKKLQALGKVSPNEDFNTFKNSFDENKVPFYEMRSFQDLKNFYFGKYRDYRPIFKSGGRDYDPEVAKAYQKMVWAHFGEAAWRVGNGLFDSIIFFLIFNGVGALAHYIH